MNDFQHPADLSVTSKTDPRGITELLLEGQPLLAHDAAYRELLAHLPLSSHPRPSNCLLLGGSDTLVLQELLKMPQLKSVTVIDTLPLISCLARRFLPNATAALNDPRVDLRILSAEQLQNFVDFSGPSYDTVLVDRPVTGLPLSRNLLDGLKGLLKPSGCLVTSVKSPWQNLPAVKELYGEALLTFPNVSFGYAGLLEQDGTVGFLVACLDAKRNLRAARRTVRNTVYWSPAIQMACFSLPRFASDALLQVEEENPRYQRPDLDNQSLSPFDLPERFRLSPDKLWIASANMNMGLRVSPTRQVFNQLSTT